MVEHLLVLQGHVFGKGAGFLEREDLVKFGLGKELWPMGIMVVAGLEREAVIETWEVLGSEGVGCLDG